MPSIIAQSRQANCKRAGCRHALDYSDPCAACPDGHFQPFGMDCFDYKKSDSQSRFRAWIMPLPGDFLAGAIKLLTGIKPSPGCACKSRRALMNKWGWSGSLKHIPLITRWMFHESATRLTRFLRHRLPT